jgi:hypothetical protein
MKKLNNFKNFLFEKHQVLFEDYKESLYKNARTIKSAIEVNNFSVFKKLLNKDNVNDTINEYNTNILGYCISYSGHARYDMVKYIISTFPNVELKKNDLLTMINFDRKKIITIIYPLIRDKYINIQIYKLSILHYAANKQNIWLVNRLLKDDADITISPEGKTFIDYIKNKNQLEKIKKRFPEKYKKALILQKTNKFNL